MNITDAMAVYTALVEAMAAIDELPPGEARANLWMRLVKAKSIVMVAIEETGAEIEIKEGA